MDDKLFSPAIYYVLCALLTAGILFGIYLMGKVEQSRRGNIISAVCMLLAIVLTMVYYNIISYWVLYIAIIIGSGVGVYLGRKVKMIQMPEMVALLNGLGGGASAIVGAFALFGIGAGTDYFSSASSGLAVAIGAITFSGSIIAAAKLHRLLPQKPVQLKYHKLYTILSLVLMAVSIILAAAKVIPSAYVWILLIVNLIASLAFGVLFSIRVGGADMPITISLLNSLSGVAGAIAGLAVGDILLVAVGGIVGASGLILTKIMCKAINRSLADILLGKTSVAAAKPSQTPAPEQIEATEVEADPSESVAADPIEVIKAAKNVIIVPGYGMAIAQAQHVVKALQDKLTGNGAKVKYAIHPVAGRMPGHMNVLLCEANVDYEDLFEMDDINGEFETADAAIVIGANDVLNPAAREAVGTPIYGMPVLSADKCKNIFIFNYDKKPGYAGVENPLYNRKHGVYLYFGNAAQTLADFLSKL